MFKNRYGYTKTTIKFIEITKSVVIKINIKLLLYKLVRKKFLQNFSRNYFISNKIVFLKPTFILYYQQFIPLKIFLVASLFSIFLTCKAQENSESDRSNYEKYVLSMSSFTVYGDSYFTTGTSLKEQISPQTSDVKFKFGLKQRLTNRALPWETLLFFTYRQKTFCVILVN